MPVFAYRGAPFGTTHENEAFDRLIDLLEAEWGGSDEPIALVGNCYVGGNELDAVILQRDAITVVDFKDYSGEIRFEENGPWTADGVPVRGGNQTNPFVQLRANRFALLNKLAAGRRLPSGARPNWGHISALVLFHGGPIEFDRTALPGPVAPWFFVSDMGGVVRRLRQITSSTISLSESDIGAIVRQLNVPAYVVPGRARPAPAGIAPATGEDWTKQLEALDAFVASDDDVLIVTGMVGTGLDEFLDATVDHMQGRRETRVLAPGRRYTNAMNRQAESIYGARGIYDAQPRVQAKRLEYACRACDLPASAVLVVAYGHRLTNAGSDEYRRGYGSGRVLDDLLEFARSGGAHRKLVVFGDPYELTFGSTTAISPEHPAYSNAEVRTIQLDRFLAHAAAAPIVRAAEEVAGRIRAGDREELKLPYDGESVVARLGDHPLDIVAEEAGARVLTFRNAAALEFNAAYRTRLGRPSDLSPGDVLFLASGCSTLLGADGVAASARGYMPGGTTIVVRRVLEPEPYAIQLKGNENPTEFSFVEVEFDHGTTPGTGPPTGSCKLLWGTWLTEKPEVSSAVERAIWDWTERRFAETDVESHHQPDKEARERRRAEFLATDPYLNAGRARWGWALTAHAAHGQTFDIAVSDMERSDLRWLYSVVARARIKLIATGDPSRDHFTDLRWRGTTPRLEPFVFPDPIAHLSDDAPPAQGLPPGTELPEPRHRAAYARLAPALDAVGLGVLEVRPQPYALNVCVRTGDEAEFLLVASFNEKRRLTRFQAPSAHLALLRALYRYEWSDLEPEGELERSARLTLEARLGDVGLRLVHWVHHHYQLRAIVEAGVESASVNFRYNKKGVFGSAELTAATSSDFVDQLREVFP